MRKHFRCKNRCFSGSALILSILLILLRVALLSILPILLRITLRNILLILLRITLRNILLILLRITLRNILSVLLNIRLTVRLIGIILRHALRNRRTSYFPVCAIILASCRTVDNKYLPTDHPKQSCQAAYRTLSVSVELQAEFPALKMKRQQKRLPT